MPDVFTLAAWILPLIMVGAWIISTRTWWLAAIIIGGSSLAGLTSAWYAGDEDDDCFSDQCSDDRDSWEH